MIVKRFGCTAIHNKALYKCVIHSFIPQTFEMRLYSDFIIHLKNKNNSNLFWSYLLLIAQLSLSLI